MVRTHNIAGYGLGVMYEIIDCKRISEDEHSALKGIPGPHRGILCLHGPECTASSELHHAQTVRQPAYRNLSPTRRFSVLTDRTSRTRSDSIPATSLR